MHIYDGIAYRMHVFSGLKSVICYDTSRWRMEMIRMCIITPIVLNVMESNRLAQRAFIELSDSRVHREDMYEWSILCWSSKYSQIIG